MKHPRKPIPTWMWIFTGIGIYATVIHLLQAFMMLGRSTKQPRADTLPEPGSREFFTALSATVNAQVHRGGRAELLNNGDEFFPVFLQAIREARHSIHLMTYIWRPGRIADEVFAALIERAREGVEVRLMIDGIGSFIAPRHHLRALQKAGGHVAIFSPLFSSRFLHVNQRNHRRAFVFDGRIAFTGGMSIADQWLGNGQDPHHWRDMMVRVTGPMARSVQVAFLHLWTNVTGEHLVGPAYMPPLTDEETAGDTVHLGVAHSPDPAEQPMLHVLWLSMQSARKRIYLTNSYFAPSRAIWKCLIERAEAGVDVRLLLPSRHIDNPFVRWAAQSLYGEFLEAGIRIFEYTPSMMHGKMLLVDDCWTIVGSANIDIRSIKLNQENVLGIADRELAKRVEQQFLADCARSREIQLDRWNSRPWWRYAREGLFTLFRAQY